MNGRKQHHAPSNAAHLVQNEALLLILLLVILLLDESCFCSDSKT